jgi:CRISPR-associated endonuclease Csn1
MAATTDSDFVLGLDIGVSSVGWALLDRRNQRFVSAGVRIFDSGMDENKFAKGEQGASNNVERRTARLHRRQLRRRAARQRELFVALQDAGLLPAEPRGAAPEARHTLWTDLDGRLTAAWGKRIAAENPSVMAPQHVLPYFLRARALDHRLEPHELGRALYHLGQRRGYKSNRKDDSSPDLQSLEASKNRKKVSAAEDDTKKVLVEIAGLEAEIAASARTLGEFLSRMDPAAARIRTRHTGRAMFEDEFEKIWAAQAPHYPQILTAELKARLHGLLFHQRPISAGKPGMCELEPHCLRAEMCTLAAQRFRLVQKLNDLAVISAGGTREPLTPEQHARVSQRLEEGGDITFVQLRAFLGLPKTAKFNLEVLDEEKKLPGNRTNAVMLRAFGDRWKTLSDSERKRIVRLWADADYPADVERLATEQWSLAPDAARQLASQKSEKGYCKLSLHAISRLLDRMEAGEPFKTAEARLYPNRFSGEKEKDQLPPVAKVLPLIPNPAVLRALTELRKVVNHIIRQYGKPAQVRVELARDLKRSAKDRQRLMDVMEDNRKRRAKVVARIQKEAGIQDPSGRDIEKGLLFEELPECAYCGKTISFANLFSDAPLFDVDHILPRSRFPDNSFSNKTLACNTCNAQKTHRTPYEAFASDPERWPAMVARVSRKKKAGRHDRFALGWDKHQRFLLKTTEELADFSARHLADTRYITKLAARYLEELYGGRDRQVPWEDQNQRCVFASSGMVTATLRKAWGLNAVLPQPEGAKNREEKKRIDHRHHAVDAMVIALSSQARVQQLSAAAAVGDGRIAERVSSRTLQAPWPGFVDSLRPLIEAINVSHRPDHKLSGTLHDETNYGRSRPYNGKDYVHVRKPVHTLSAKNISSDDVIVDRKIREAVQTKLSELGNDPKKLESNPAMLLTRTGRQIRIHNVRIRDMKRTVPLAHGAVALNENHHVWIAARLDNRDREIEWTGDVVSRFEAVEAHGRTKKEKKRTPIVKRDIRTEDGEVLRFKFSLMKGDMVEMDDWKSRERTLFIVNKFSAYSSGAVVISLSRHTDARIQTDMMKTGDFRGLSPETLRKANCRKVIVDALGRVHEAHD